MRYLIAVVLWLLVFLIAVLYASYSVEASGMETSDAETLSQTGVEQEVVEEGIQEDSQDVDSLNDMRDTEEIQEDSQSTDIIPIDAEEIREDSQDTDSLSDVEDTEELSADPLPEFSLSSEAEKRLSERIREISEEAQRRERSSYALSYLAGYTDQGVDEVLPEHFFQGHIVSQGIAFSHRAGFRLAIENLTSIAGGGFSDMGDRTLLSAEVWKKSGFLYGSVQHRWVHANYRVSEDFFFGDRHRTAVRVGLMIGPLQPHAFVASDLPAYMSVNEMAVYGGGGVDIRFDIDQLNTGFYFGASIAESLYLYNQDGKALYRVRAGFATSIGGLVVNPEVLFLRGVYTSESLLTSSFRIAF